MRPMVRVLRRQTASGFTLVEMLIVAIVILLLSAILLRNIGHFGEEANRKRCVAQLEALKNALNEYYTAYGTYPPVDFLAYEYESRTNQPLAWQKWLEAHNDPTNPDRFFQDTDRNRTEGYASSRIDGELGYRYGLVSYLWPRAMGDQTHFYDEDTDRDEIVKDRMADFLRIVDLSTTFRTRSSPPHSGLTLFYSNMVTTIRDPWGNEYRYRCPPPHQWYRLWSPGPDGKDETGDDVACGPSGGAWNE